MVNEHEFDLSTVQPGEHRFNRQVGSFIECSIPGHSEAISIHQSHGTLTVNEKGELITE